MTTRPFLVTQSLPWVSRVVGTPVVRVLPGSMLLVRDLEHGGRHRITGTTKNTGTPTNAPVSRRVRLHNQQTGALVREVWSDADTGAYAFDHIAPGTYYITAFDHTNTYNGELATDLVAEPMTGATP